MNRKRWNHRTSQRGTSLVEVTLAATMFAGIGYVLLMSIRANEGSHQTVRTTAGKNAELRETTASLRDELRSAHGGRIVVDESNGHTRLTFQVAIRGAGGAAAWGAFDRRISNDEDDCHRENWRLRYEVVNDQIAGPQLRRRVIDDVDGLHCEDVLATDVTEFRVSQTGDVWLVRLATDGEAGKSEDEFDVRTRSQ